MPSYSPPKKNTAYVLYVSLVSQANTKIMLVNPTLATGDVKVAIDDGAPANLATLPVVDADFTKRVKVDLSAAEMNGDRITVIFSDASGDAWCDLTVDIATVTNQFDALATQASVNTIDDFLDTEIVDIQNRLPAALVSGRIDSSVGAMATDTVNAAALAADAIAEINATVDTALADYDAPTRAELTSDIASLNNVSAAQVNAEILDVLTVDTFAEPSAVPATTSTLKDKINWLFILARNKLTQTSTTQLVRNDADAATVGTATVSDDLTTASRGKFS